MENKPKIILMGFLVLVVCIGINFKNLKKNETATDLNVVLSLEDTITDNTIWCGTLNLIWNDLKEVAGGDITFNPQLDIVKHLNNGTFSTQELNENSYYKVVNTPSLELKAKIEREIKEKFNETSDILDDFNWENMKDKDYFLYAMLKKEFEFDSVFTELKKDKFKNSIETSYFGINSETSESVREQVEVLYYKNMDDFAIRLKTKNEDEIILTRGRNENSFKEIYDSISKESENYKNSKTFGKSDTLKIPNLNFKTIKEFTELENKEFSFANGEKYYIEKALQTIQFELTKKGGKVKSEAGMGVKNFALIDETEPRQFSLDDTFVLFLKEKESILPYLAMKVDDISKFV